LQDTLREPPRAAVSMRKAITASMSTCYGLYMLVGCLGYAALGDSVPPSIFQVGKNTHA
jgi:amino acid permease